MRQQLYQLADDNLAFPEVSHALVEPNGLLAIGGDLSAQRLINAYSRGIFPWFSENDPFMWWSPNPRAVLKAEHLRINRTLRKNINRSPYSITLNKQFEQVNQLCASAPFRQEDTWIVPSMQKAYVTLHQLGYAHSVEVWQNDELVGGLYGVAINGFFSGESMFYKQPNASKFALVALIQLLSGAGIHFIDCQLLNPFLEDMGAIEIDRCQFLNLQQAAIHKDMPQDFWRARSLTIQPSL